jgi:hypothetical protein
MAKPKITDAELRKMQAEDRHNELISSLKDIANRPGVENIVGEVGKLIKTIIAQKPIDMSPIAKELSSGIAELKQALEMRPKSFTIERNKVGLITKIVPEY